MHHYSGRDEWWNEFHSTASRAIGVPDQARDIENWTAYINIASGSSK
jgi:hypothetical protein